MEFLLTNWAILLPAAIVFFDVVANLTPSTKDNKISSALARLVNAIVPDKRK